MLASLMQHASGTQADVSDLHCKYINEITVRTILTDKKI